MVSVPIISQLIQITMETGRC